MRRLLKWAVITLGIAALVRWWRERRSGETPPEDATQPAVADPADELRRKLAESRSEEEPAAAATDESAVDERRAEVHAEGRAAIDEMQSSGEDA